MKPLHGTLFSVPLPSGTALWGRVILDIDACIKRRLFPHDSPLPGLGKAYLVEMYMPGVVPPVLSGPSILIPGAFIESGYIGSDWPIVGYVPIDPRRVEFPEGLIGFMHSHGQTAFRCGEIQVPTPFGLQDSQDRIPERIRRHSAFLWPYTCLRALGRDSEIPPEYSGATLQGSDLRFSPHREEVYKLLPFPMTASYYDKQLQMGMQLERLYQ